MIEPPAGAELIIGESNCIRLVRAQQAEPNKKRAYPSGKPFFFATMIEPPAGAELIIGESNCIRLVRAQQAEPNKKRAYPSGKPFFFAQ